MHSIKGAMLELLSRENEVPIYCGISFQKFKTTSLVPKSSGVSSYDSEKQFHERRQTDSSVSQHTSEKHTELPLYIRTRAGYRYLE